MSRPVLPCLTLALLTACQPAGPNVTATPVSPELARPDSITYSVLAARPTYFALLALAPGQPIEILSPDPSETTPLLGPGRTVLTFPHPRALRSAGNQATAVSRILVGAGYLDELGTSGRGPGSVTYEVQPGLSTQPPGPGVILVLFPTPLGGSSLDGALPAQAASSPAATLRELQERLGLPEPLHWVPLTGTTRSAI